jgi:hypothetical protein
MKLVRNFTMPLNESHDEIWKRMLYYSVRKLFSSYHIPVMLKVRLIYGAVPPGLFKVVRRLLKMFGIV